MDQPHTHRRFPWRRSLRTAPFVVVVALCFLLPFFTVSGCEGPEATVTGAQIVAGTSLADAANTSGSATIDSEAQAVSDNARPWACIALLAAIAGIGLMTLLRRYLRPASIGLSVLGLAALLQVWSAMSADALPDGGLFFATLILGVTVACHAGALAWLALRTAHRSVHPDPQASD
jgi:hypothetical protein